MDRWGQSNSPVAKYRDNIFSLHSQSLIQHEREQLIAAGGEDVPAAIEYVGLGRVAGVTDARVPQRLARGRQAGVGLPVPKMSRCDSGS